MDRKWTQREIDSLPAAIQSVEGKTLNARCKKLDGWHGRSAEALYQKAEELNLGNIVDYDAYLSGMANVNVLRAEVSRLENENQDYRIYWKRFEDACAVAAAKLPPVKIKRPKFEERKAAKGYVVVLECSDWQPAEYKTGDISGIGNYTPAIMEKRVDALIEKVLLMREYHKKLWPAQKICIDLLGDFVEGWDIYPGQAAYVKQNALDQTLFVADLLTRMLATFAEYYPQVWVNAVIGNHGRISKGHHKLDNFDYIAYRLLLERFHPYFADKPARPGVDLRISTGMRMLYQLPEIPWAVHGIWHGDDLKTNLSVPYYAMDRTTARMVQLFETPIHFPRTAHHHREAEAALPNYGRWFINGSLVGPTPYSVDKLATATAPSQIMLIMHKDVGVVSHETLYVEKRIELKPDERGVLTPTVPIPDYGKRR